MVASLAPGYVFLFFCGMIVLQLVWVVWAVPETRGVPPEVIEQRPTRTAGAAERPPAPARTAGSFS